MLQPLNKGFQDKNAHVRKTSAMACISLFELDPVFVLGKETGDHRIFTPVRRNSTMIKLHICCV